MKPRTAGNMSISEAEELAAAQARRANRRVEAYQIYRVDRNIFQIYYVEEYRTRQALAAAQARVKQRLRDAEERYRVEVDKIGRHVTGFLDLPADLSNMVYRHATL